MLIISNEDDVMNAIEYLNKKNKRKDSRVNIIPERHIAYCIYRKKKNIESRIDRIKYYKKMDI